MEISLQPKELLYLLEYNRIVKLGQASKFISMEFPETQIPLALRTLLADQDLSLVLPLLSEGGKLEPRPASVYDRNPAGRGLDFDDCPEQQADSYSCDATGLL